MEGTGSFLGNWTIPTPSGGACDIQVGRGTATVANVVPDGFSRLVFMTQPTTTDLARRLEGAAIRSGADTQILTLPDGDAAKNLSVVDRTYRDLNSLGFTRGDLIVAIGGGALTDTAGFIAATYLRGVAVTYLSTTVLGAVDAAIGGKTGVNVGGKNLAGVFRHPLRVVVDLDILDDLPVHLVREGAAEAVKAGFIADSQIVAAYEERGLDAALDDIVPAAIGVKVRTVVADFEESGVRAILNYGHTVGHAIEIAAGISHGEAVAIGMVAAGRASADMLGFPHAVRQKRIIANIGLPVTAPAVDAAEVLHLMHRDKKRDEAGLRMVLLEDFGRPVLTHVSQEVVAGSLSEIGVDTE